MAVKKQKNFPHNSVKNRLGVTKNQETLTFCARSGRRDEPETLCTAKGLLSWVTIRDLISNETPQSQLGDSQDSRMASNERTGPRRRKAYLSMCSEAFI
jgi:hypothetical protein